MTGSVCVCEQLTHLSDSTLVMLFHVISWISSVPLGMAALVLSP